MPATRPKRVRRSNAIIYDIVLWAWTVVLDLFFREIHPRSTWRIPKTGPVIFVAAPHANQFIDPLLLMRVVRHDAGRRIAFLIAEKSMKRSFIGFAARLVDSVPVGRALDLKKPAKGKIYLPDPDGDLTLLKGNDTDFKSQQFMPGGLVVLPSVNNVSANTEIQEILGPNELRLKKPFKGDIARKQLTGQPLEEESESVTNGNSHDGPKEFEGIEFSVSPHVDQSKVYEQVFKRIREGGCIGIFPEGGSHDRTELLPLKAGLAIMALGALAEDPNCGVTIVPVGMNYFHAHKFRSRAVIEFGAPIEIDPELVDQYKSGNRRDAVSKVLQTVYDRLSAVTVQAPDYDTLMLIQAVRRLYRPQGKKLPLPYVVELNRRLIKGYTTYQNDPRIVHLKKTILDYNRDLFRLNIRDHQVSYARFSWYKVLLTLAYRALKLVALSIAVLPGVILFAPVFILGKIISRQKAKEALAASTVKIRARDVVATWKVLVSLALAPALDIVYTTVLVSWAYSNRIGGRLPNWVPLWIVAISGLIWFPVVCFAALRFGEIGMDIFKSLRPLFLSLNPSQSNTLVKLRHRREWLQEKVNEIINELGPELFPDFDQGRIVSNPSQYTHSPERERPETPTQSEFDALSFTPNSPPPPLHRHHTVAIADPFHHIPRNESLSDIGNIGLFASREGSPVHSRSNSRKFGTGGFKLRGFTSINKDSKTQTKGNLEEVSRNLQAAMRERGRRRKSGSGFELVDTSEDEGATTPSTSDFEPVDAKKDI